MGESTRMGVASFLAVSLLAAILLAERTFLDPVTERMHVRREYRRLEYEGVIDKAVADRYDMGYVQAARDQLPFVASSLAGPALIAQRDNAFPGFVLAGVNVAFAIWLLVKTRPGAIAKGTGTIKPTSPPASSPPAVSPPQVEPLGGRHL
jgi:hypothetical protein